MNSATDISNRYAAEPEEAMVGADLAGKIKTIARRNVSFAVRCRDAADAIAESYRSPYVALQLQSASRSSMHEVVAGSMPGSFWKPFADVVAIEALAGNTVVIDHLADSASGLHAAVCGVPVRDWHDEAVGSLVVIFACDDDRLASATGDRLLALVSLLAVPDEAPKNELPESQSNAAESLALRYESFDQMAMAIVNGIKNKYGFAEVQLGIVRGNRVRVTTISGRSKFHRGAPGVVGIQQAFEECFDASRPLGSHPELDESFEPRRRYVLHERWSREAGGCPVITIPLLDGEKIVAIIGFRLEATDSVLPVSLVELGQKVTAFGSALSLADRLFRPWWRVAGETFTKRLGGLTRIQRVGSTLGLIAAVGLLIWGVTSHPYIEAVTAEIDNRSRSVHAAPFAAVLREVHVRPGDHVSAGEALYRLDDESLVLRRDELKARIELTKVQRARALVEGRSGEAGEAHAELQALSAELSVVEQRIESSISRARHAGYVVGEDLFPRCGEEVAVGDPLIELAADGGVVLRIEVPETLAHAVLPEHHGWFSSAAKPNERHRFVVERVERAAQVIDGKSIYLAEARFESLGDIDRLGTTGTARVELGSRSGAWLLWHAPWRYLRHQVNQL